MATIPDERLEPVAAVEKAKKITPAALRVIDVPGTGAQLLGNLRQVSSMRGPGRGIRTTTSSRCSSSS
jgi:ribosome-binding ATPase